MHMECLLGPHKVHILPPICITPQTVVRDELWILIQGTGTFLPARYMIQ